jgi:hypothetical protein
MDIRGHAARLRAGMVLSETSQYNPHPLTDQKIKIAKPGAILGARSYSRPRTTTHAHGTPTAVLGLNAYSPDQSRRLIKTYGTEGQYSNGAGPSRVRARPCASARAWMTVLKAGVQSSGRSSQDHQRSLPVRPRLEIGGRTMQHPHRSGRWRMEDQPPGATFATRRSGVQVPLAPPRANSR